MRELHSLLRRQLKRHFKSAEKLGGEWRRFFDEINEAYFQFDDDRKMLERSLDLSSQELVQANSEMRGIFQALPDLYFLLDDKGKILDCKGGQAMDFLLPPQALLGKRIQDVPLQNIGKIFQNAIDILQSSKQMVDIEYSMLANDIILFYEARLVPLPESNIVAIVRNITDRKRAEESLRESKEGYRLIVENINEVIYRVSIQNDLLLGAVQYVSPQIENVLGYTVDEFLRQPPNFWLQMVHPDDLSAMKETTRKIYATKTTGIRTYRFRHKRTGEYRWMEDRIVPLLDSTGEVNGFQGASRDITDRKHTEQELERSFSLLRATLESTADGILVVDSQGKIMSYNKKFVEMWRIPDSIMEALDDEKALKYVLDQLVNPEEFLKKVKELYAQPEAESYDVLEFKDGRIFERYSQSQSIGGKSAGRVWSFRDVSEQRRLEEQLRHSQKMESIGTLAGGIAHDFNNILGIITGYASVLEKQVNSPAEFARSIEAIIKTSERGATVVRQMLTFARKTTVEFESVNINAVVKELEKMLKHTFPRTISFSLQLDQRIPSIVADHNQIHQALLNLCVNAKDAMQESGTLTIQTSVIEGMNVKERFSDAESQQYVSVNIMDTGHGMDEVTRSRIFEPFFTTKGPGKGTGLGLAVVYGIVNNHRGFIDVDTQLGQGTTFSLYFPITLQADEISHDVRENPVDIPGGSETILVVEDEEMLLGLLKDILEGMGYDVLTAQDGLEGIEVYTRHQHQVALVLTDMGLPKLNGREVYKRMKAVNPQVRVIIASGYLDPDLRADLLNNGVKDFIQKPYILNDVLKRVHTVLGSG